VTRQWDRLRESRIYFHRMGVILFAVGAVLALLDIWTRLTVPAAVVPALLAMQCFMAFTALQSQIDMQARIDMILVAKGEEPE